MKNEAIRISSLTPKIKQFPKGLIYKVPDRNSYRLVDTKTGNLVGKMQAFPVNGYIYSYYNLKKDEQIFRIYSLDIEEREQNKGWGTYFMDFAKKESYRRGCEGRCNLVAYNPWKSPHIFYKKQGFITTDENLNKTLDEHIAKNESPLHIKAIEMFIPIKKFTSDKKTEPTVESKNCLEIFFENIKNLINKSLVF